MSTMSSKTFGSDCGSKDDMLCTISVWIWRVIPPLQTAIGTLGNILNIIILLRKNLRSKPCFILGFLAVSDLIVIWSVFVADCLLFGFGYQPPDFTCVLFYFLKFGFTSVSLWIMAIFTFERFIFVVLPHQSNSLLTNSKTKGIVCLILIIVLPSCGLPFWKSTSADIRQDSIEVNVAPNNTIPGPFIKKDTVPSNVSTPRKTTGTSNKPPQTSTNQTDNYYLGSTTVLNDMSLLNNNSIGLNCCTTNEVMWNNSRIELSFNYPKFKCFSPSLDKESFVFAVQVFNLVFGIFTPITIVVLGNGSLIIALSRRQTLVNTKDSQTTLLFIICGLLMITITPQSIKYIYFLARGFDDYDAPLFAFINALTECFINLNFTINFFCYLWKSTLFKEECKLLYRDIKSKLGT